MTRDDLASLIDNSPMNRGLIGSQWLSNPDNIPLVANGNAMLFEKQAPGVYEFHWLHSATKGRPLIRDTREAMRTIFVVAQAALIFGYIPVAHRASQLMARWIGARPLGKFFLEGEEVTHFVMLPEFLEKAQ